MDRFALTVIQELYKLFWLFLLVVVVLELLDPLGSSRVDQTSSIFRVLPFLRI